VSQLSSAAELFSAAPRAPRSWTAVAVSSVLHVAVVVPVLYFARETVSTAVPRAAHVLTFVSAMPAPDPAFVVPLAPVHKVAPKPAEPIAAFKEPPPAAVAPVVAARVEPKPVVPEPRREATPKPEPPRPPTPPPVAVGTFAAASVPSHWSRHKV